MIFESDIELGRKYRDRLTGIEGPATACGFFLHGCERVTLEFVKDGEVKYQDFDAPRLDLLNEANEPESSVKLQPGLTGGPHRMPKGRGDR